MAVRESIWGSGLPPAQRLVALALVDHADRAGVCFPGTARLTDRTGLSRSSVLRAVAALEAARVVVAARGHGRKARYQFPLVSGGHHPAPDDTPQVVSQGHQLDPPAPGSEVVSQCDQCHGDTSVTVTQGGVKSSRADRVNPKASQLVLEQVQELVDPVDVLHEHWTKTLWSRFHRRPPKLTPERRRKYESRLKDGYSVEDLCRAIDSVAESPFHMGENDRRRPYIEPETIFRTASRVDGWLAAPARRVARGGRNAPAQPDHGKTGWE